MNFETIPSDNWTEIEYETGPKRADGPFTEEFEGKWASNDKHIIIQSRHTVSSDGKVSYPVMVVQEIGDDELSTRITTHARIADDRKGVEEIVVEFMKDVDDGKHEVRTLGVEVPDDNDFVQFYTISNSEVPGDMTADEFVDIIESGKDEYGNDIGDLSDSIDRETAEDHMIQVDIFPRLKEEVDGFDDEDN